jgi:hypothetical protein
MNTKTKSVLMRLLKGGIAGAITTMGGITYIMPTLWSEFGAILNSLALAGSFGFIVGLLMALEKWISWKEEPVL